MSTVDLDRAALEIQIKIILKISLFPLPLEERILSLLEGFLFLHQVPQSPISIGIELFREVDRVIYIDLIILTRIFRYTCQSLPVVFDEFVSVGWGKGVSDHAHAHDGTRVDHWVVGNVLVVQGQVVEVTTTGFSAHEVVYVVLTIDVQLLLLFVALFNSDAVSHWLRA